MEVIDDKWRFIYNLIIENDIDGAVDHVKKLEKNEYSAQAHGFNDIVDNYAGYATKSPIPNGELYQLEGALNGVDGRFEWIM